jgi:hypothetical protein
MDSRQIKDKDEERRAQTERKPAPGPDAALREDPRRDGGVFLLPDSRIFLDHDQRPHVHIYIVEEGGVEESWWNRNWNECTH